VVIAGESTFLDVVTQPLGTNSYLRGSSGKIYRCGGGTSIYAPENVAVYTPMLFPAGVTSYTDMWAEQSGAGSVELFLKGNDGNIYAAGYNNAGQLGIGNTTTYVTMISTPVKVLFPAGVNIVKISCSNFGYTLALSSTGTAYAWGRWRNAPTASLYYFAATPAPADISGNYILKPSPITLPTGYNDTKFTDIWVGVNYSAVRTDKMVYFKGTNTSGILMNPGISDSKSYGTSSDFIDILSGATYNQAAPIWNKFKSIITGGTESRVYAISQSDRGYVWGKFSFGSAGIGAGTNAPVIYKPTPIGTGIGDPMNPNPLY
jgi:alpha-tubulin suppressor-like RCC1 family protein